jgi:hypothetical protein
MGLVLWHERHEGEGSAERWREREPRAGLSALTPQGKQRIDK